MRRARRFPRVRFLVLVLNLPDQVQVQGQDQVCANSLQPEACYVPGRLNRSFFTSPGLIVTVR
jgi:hypothetical protein